MTETERTDGGPCEHAGTADVRRWTCGGDTALYVCERCGRRWNEPPIVVRQTAAPARTYTGPR